MSRSQMGSAPLHAEWWAHLDELADRYGLDQHAQCAVNCDLQIANPARLRKVGQQVQI